MPTASTQQFGVTPGFVMSETTPADDQLYISPTQLSEMYGLSVDESEIRFAQSLIHAVTNRPSLLPCVYEERLSVPDDRNQVILSARPVVKILQAGGRYDYGRRDRIASNRLSYDYFVALAAIGASPANFTAIDVDQIDLFPATGECWLPGGIYLSAYHTVQIRYLTGFPQIPDRIVAALINIINDIQHKQVSDVKSRMVGKVQSHYGSTGFISQQTQQLLAPFIVTALM